MRGKALVLEEADGRLKVSEYNKDLRDQLAAKTVDEVETVLVVTPECTENRHRRDVVFLCALCLLCFLWVFCPFCLSGFSVPLC